MVLRAREDVAIPEYLLSVLRSQYAREWLRLAAVGSTMLNLNEAILGALPCAIPESPSEQSELLVVLNSRTKTVDQLIETTGKSVSLLKERRSALITAAVTGQIDLRKSA